MDNKDKDKIKLSLLTVLCNATQIYRGTIPAKKKEAYQLLEKWNELPNTPRHNTNSKTYLKSIIAAQKRLQQDVYSVHDIIQAAINYDKLLENQDNLTINSKAPGIRLSFEEWLSGVNKFTKNRMKKCNTDISITLTDCLGDYEDIEKKYHIKSNSTGVVPISSSLKYAVAPGGSEIMVRLLVTRPQPDDRRSEHIIITKRLFLIDWAILPQ